MPKLLRFEDLKGLGISWTRVHLNRLEAAGQFPKKIRLGAKTVRYAEDEILKFLDQRMAARNG